jgi:hypothetical protein
MEDKKDSKKQITAKEHGACSLKKLNLPLKINESQHYGISSLSF